MSFKPLMEGRKGPPSVHLHYRPAMVLYHCPAFILLLGRFSSRFLTHSICKCHRDASVRKERQVPRRAASTGSVCYKEAARPHCSSPPDAGRKAAAM
ncbi:hypothetical protein GDO78_007375 [Eleutherodactylus coqui]|uniref:Uncharacterized protein n=1 Tax=Eleutherodactylus coqui TaxID=57060 RepID=A0A8J6FGM0_ELECQ|nr:hypothetical protein GDO78_007375 [Eleutherodactylus coqui]